MNSLLIKNIKGIVQARNNAPDRVYGFEMDHLPILDDGYIIVSNGIIEDFGEMSAFRGNPNSFLQVIDATDRFVLPAFVDSHTHLVFAATREDEFVHKIKGMSYAEIAAKGGGILNSAKKLGETSEETLFEQSMRNANLIMQTGTGSVEIKSGYGLTLESELKMLRVIKRLKEALPLKIRSTFLGAHAFPPNKSREAYINEIIDEMIPRIAEENLAEYIDVFCEEGFFSVAESQKVLEAGVKYGLRPKVHANQLHNSGGVQLGIRVGAISVDHLETISDTEISALENSDVIPTLLPGAAFFLRMNFPPARDLIKANLPVAIASDYNPGSSPSGNMQTMLSLACVNMKMTPAEAINACTINSAAAMELKTGIITKGFPADLIITQKIPSIKYIPYSYGTNDVHSLILDGKTIF